MRTRATTTPARVSCASLGETGTRWLRSGELCRRAGVKRGVLRTYERLGLLVPAQRSSAGYRRYAAADVEKLLVIRSAKALGLTLREVRELLPLFEPQRFSRTKLLDMTRRQLAALETRLANLQRICKVLHSILHDPDRLNGPDCDLLAQLQPLPAKVVRAPRRGRA